jgi:pyruvate dehydrogenase E2 component (dihydrolipoamide acetyltransferase)
VAGTLLKIAAKEGTELPVGSLMAIIGAPGEDLAAMLGAVIAAKPGAQAPVGEVPRPGSSQLTSQLVDQSTREAPVRAPGERVKASPVAKKLAEEHGIDINTLTGTGPEGRIVREDVERAIAQKSREPRAESREGKTATPESIPGGMRKAIRPTGQPRREAAQ